MKKISVFLSLVLAFALTACSGGEDAGTPSSPGGSASDETVLQVGITGMSYPHSFREGEDIVGFDYEVIGQAAERAGYTVEYQTMDFPGLMGAVNAGRIDTVASNVTWTPERDSAYIFTVPYSYDGVGLATAANNTELTHIDQLDGKVIATGAGSTNEIAVNAWLEETGYDIEVRTFDSAQAAAHETVLGRADAVAGPNGSTIAQIEFQGLELKTLDGPLLTHEQTRFPFANTEEGQVKAEAISAALAEMKQDGTLKELSEKYFGYDRSAYSDEFSQPDPEQITTPGGN